MQPLECKYNLGEQECHEKPLVKGKKYNLFKEVWGFFKAKYQERSISPQNHVRQEKVFNLNH